MSNPLSELELLHIEMGNLIRELKNYDNIIDDTFYQQIITDYGQDNKMLGYHLRRCKENMS